MVTEWVVGLEAVGTSLSTASLSLSPQPPGVCGCAWVWVGVYGCGWVCVGVGVWVCACARSRWTCVLVRACVCRYVTSVSDLFHRVDQILPIALRVDMHPVVDSNILNLL